MLLAHRAVCATGVLCTVLGLCATIGAVSAARAADTRSERANPTTLNKPTKGLLLIADARMPDPRFRESVILLVEHSDQGTMGLIINRRTRLAVHEVLPELDASSGEDRALYFGGPVGIHRLVILLRGTPVPATSTHIIDDVYLSAASAALEELVPMTSDQQLRVFIGYAGWAQGQLESELLEGSWFLRPAEPELIFATDVDEVWRRLYEGRRRGTLVRAPDTPEAAALLAITAQP